MKVNEIREGSIVGVDDVLSVVDRMVILEFFWYMLLVVGVVMG